MVAQSLSLLIFSATAVIFVASPGNVLVCVVERMNRGRGMIGGRELHVQPAYSRGVNGGVISSLGQNADDFLDLAVAFELYDTIGLGK